MRVARPSLMQMPDGALEKWTPTPKSKPGAARNSNNNNNEKKKKRGVRKSGGNQAALAASTAAENALRMYDSSDSFENHVIDLRGDEYRGNGREEDGQTLPDSQSSQDLSRDNANGFGSDSDMDARQPNGNRPRSNGIATKHHPEAEEDESAEEDTDGAPAELLEQQFTPGHLVWAKLARFPWWPAQVMDERAVKEGKGGRPTSDTDVLVRFFGTYDYGWVDGSANLSDFEVKQAERSRVRKKALQKGVEEALLFQQSGQAPKDWERLSKKPDEKKSQNGHANGMNSPDPSGDSPRKTPRKRKPKVLFEEVRVERKLQRLPRRIRVMRQLGLAAPAGSPFTADCS